jgi:hypothetical protein
MFFFDTVLILAYLFMTSQAVSECSDNPLIQPTSEGYNLAKTNSKLSAWWQNVSQSSNSGFANELAKKRLPSLQVWYWLRGKLYYT